MNILPDKKRSQYLKQAKTSKYTNYPVAELTRDLLELLEQGGYVLAQNKGYTLGDMVEILLPMMKNLCSKIVKELTGFCRDEVEDGKDLVQEIRRGIFEALLKYKPGTIKEDKEEKIDREIEKEIEIYFSIKPANKGESSEKKKKPPASFSSFCYFWVRKYLRATKFSTELYGITSDFSFISEKELTEYKQNKKNGYKTHRVYLITELMFEDETEEDTALYRRNKSSWQQKESSLWL